MISKAEILVDAIGAYFGINDPLTVCYKIKNPLMTKSFGRAGKHEINEDGVRVFSSIISGYRAAVFDMAEKLSGKSRSGIKPNDLLGNLFRVYGLKDAGAAVIPIRFLRKAFNDTEISEKTPLSYFQEAK